MVRFKQDIISKLKYYNIKPDKELGQHFILDKKILLKEVKYAKINKRDTVLEIGASIGNLTEILAKIAGKVITVEKDRRYKRVLEDIASKYRNIDIIFGDASKIDFPKFNKCVSNLPFKFSLPIIFNLLRHNFNLSVLVVQKKLGEKIVAKPSKKKYGRISVLISRFGDSRIIEFVPRHIFFPEPRVDACIVKIKKTKPGFSVINEKNFSNLLDYLFLFRKKPLSYAISNLTFLGFSIKNISKVIYKLGYLRKKIIAELTPKEFSIIESILFKEGISLPEVPKELKMKVEKFKTPYELFAKFLNLKNQ